MEGHTPSHINSPVASTSQKKRRRRQSPRTFTPSSRISSILATFAASSSGVDGSPLFGPRTPPPFLCPFIESEDAAARCPPARRAYLSADTILEIEPQGPTQSKRSLSKRSSIPDWYQLGDDGNWHRVEEYTLYGSTICPHCDPASTSAAISTSTPTLTSTPISQPTSSPMPDILDQLPTGWKPSDARGTRTTLILAVSLILAFFICFFMISCIIWRGKRARMAKKRDEEMKMRRRPRDDVQDETDALVEREDKLNRHLWARATARWKANARYLARQRRGNRRSARHLPPLQTTPVAPDESASCMQNQRPSDFSPIPPISTPGSSASSTHDLSLRPSTSSGPQDQIDIAPPPINLHNPPSPPSSPPPPPSPHLASLSPPAYHAGATSSLPAMHKSPEAYHASGHPPCSADSLSHPLADPFFSEEPTSPHQPFLYTAHVATDDKALISRMATMANAPLQESAVDSGRETLDIQASVPVWEDEQLEDFPHPGSSKPGLPLHATASSFPPPPSAVKESSQYLYDYDFSYEDVEMDIVECDIGPSAPPFEEVCPNTPFVNMTPSAPPLHGDSQEITTGLPTGDRDRDGEDMGSDELQNHNREVDSPDSSGQRTSSASECDLPVDDSNPPRYHS